MASLRVLPDQSYLQECFRYDPDTGHLFWRKRPSEHFKTQRAYNNWNKRFPGKRADHVRISKPKRGKTYAFCVTGLNLDLFITARVIFKMLNGYDPIEIDHENLNATNNKIKNLREGGRSNNAYNRVVRADSQSRLKGVCQKSTNSFEATITHNKKRIYLGRFNTAQEAHKAYCAAAEKYHGAFVRF